MRDASTLNHASWPDDRLTVAYLGHASLLVNFFGIRLISDPTLFERIGLSLKSLVTVGPKRVAPAPLAPKALNPLDLVLITHAHMDHLDIRSLATLPKKAVVVAAQGCSRLLRPLGFNDVRELRWGESTTVSGLTIRAMGARHWGKRWPPLGVDYGFASYVLEKDGHRMLLACDSAYTELFDELSANPPHVAAFSIAAYDPFIWNHANPEEVWRMFLQTGAQHLVPIHWGTFRLSREPMDEPMSRLVAAAGADEYRIVMREIGGVWTMPHTRTHTDIETPEGTIAGVMEMRGRGQG